MTDESETQTENLSTTDASDAGEFNPAETVEESFLGVLEEADAEKAAEVAEKGDTEEAPAENPLTKAARTLASAKSSKKGQKQVVEAAALDVPAKPQKQAKAPLVDDDKTYDPPQRFPVDQKEKFLKYPKDIQKQIVSDYKEWEGAITKVTQDARREQSKYQEVNQVIDHYLPRWGMNNITPGQAVRELCAAQDLINQDPVHALNLLMQRTGVTPEHIVAKRGGQQSAPVQQQQSFAPARAPQQNLLTREDIPTILEQIQTQQRMQQDFGALESLRNKKGPNGNYLYPELWDQNNQAGNYWNRGYLSRLEPLVEGIRKTHGVSIDKATEQALPMLRQIDGTFVPSPSLNGPRLSPQQEIQRARTASASVKGRGNVATPSQTEPDLNERVEDSFLAVMHGSNNGY